MINSVRYAELGEARHRTYEASIRCYSKKNRRCGQRALRRIIKKMRDAHFAGESGFAPTELVSNNLYT